MKKILLLLVLLIMLTGCSVYKDTGSLIQIEVWETGAIQHPVDFLSGDRWKVEFNEDMLAVITIHSGHNFWRCYYTGLQVGTTDLIVTHSNGKSITYKVEVR